MLMLRYFISICLFCSTTCTQMTTQELLKSFLLQTLRELNGAINKTDHVRQNSLVTPAYEECYRRMVDIYNSTLTTDMAHAHTTDQIMFLKHVENYFWILEHLSHMLHELEKKHKLKRAGLFVQHPIFTVRPDTRTKARFRHHSEVTMTAPTKRSKQTWWQLDYGWEGNERW